MDATWRNNFGTESAVEKTRAPGRAMNRFAKVLVLFVSLIGLGAWSGNAQAAIITSTATGGLWSATTTWVGGVAPLATDSAVIATTGANTVTLGANTGVVALTVNAGSTLNLVASRIRPTGATSISGTINIGTNTGSRFAGLVTINAGGVWSNASNVAVNFRGGLTNNGGTFTAGTGIQTFGTTAQAIGGTSPITIPNLAVATVAVTNNGNLTVSTALTGTTGSLVNGATGTLNLGGTSAITTLTATAVGNTVNYTGAAQTVKATAYSNLGLSGSGAKTLTGVTTVGANLTLSGTATATTAANFTIGGNLTIGAGTTFANSTFALNVAGNFDQSGTFTAGAGVVTLNGGAVVQTISGAGTLGFANLTINNTGGITLARNVTVTSAIIGAHPLTSTCPTDWTLTSNGGVTVEHSCAASVVSINCSVSCAATSAATVSWTVIFNNSVTGVAPGNFTLVNSGLGGTPAITLVSGGGTTWTVTASTGTGTGTLGLNMANATGVTPTVTNLPFTGQVYSIVGAGVINTYYPGTASVLTGATSITLGAATGAATPIAIGDMLLIMQMQDATIDITNTATYGTVSGTPTAGKYEYAIATSAVPLIGGTLTLCALTNAYTDAAYVVGSSGQKRFQVIRVPVYASHTLGATTALAWNGSTGGVLAFDVTGALNLNTATVDVSGTGFRGGASRLLAGPGATGANTDYRTLATVNNNASKGEGIAGTPFYVFTAPSTLTNTTVEGYPNGSHARGAPANGGGGGTDRSPADNQQNTGGGGGANGGAGGLGGIAWCPTFNPVITTVPAPYGCGPNSGGLGGNPVTGLGPTRLTLGGGGGGGTTNNGTGALAGGLSSSGAAGGGIIMLRAGSMSGAATFNANGSNGDSTIRNDGSGGGGAGGVVLISTGSGIGGATINVNGGIGGSNLVPPGTTSPPHGPGGGGGGGYAITTGAPAASSAAAAGANGVTYNVGVLFGAYGATAGSAGSSNSGLTAAAIPGVALGAASCTAPLDHLEIQHASGTGLTCVASTLTIKACTDTAVPCVTPYTGGVTGTLSATGTPTVNWDGTTGGAAGAGFVIPNGSSSVTKNVQVATAGTVVFGVSSAAPAPTNATTMCNFGAPSCTFTASLAGFIFSDTTAPGNVYTIPSQVSGIATSTLYLRAVQATTTSPAVCTPAIIGQTTPVNMGYVCNNPAACQAGNLTTINATAIAPGGTSVSLTFDANGSAPITARYDDVGQITLNANKTVTPPNGTAVTLNGSSNAFVVKPHHFDLSGIQQTAAPNLVNPAAANAAGAKFVKAGEQFSVTVTARNFANAATPNFGKETTPESVKLTNALVTGLGLTNNPAVSGTFGAFANGVATADGVTFLPDGVTRSTPFTWNEAGIITLTPSILSGNYLGVAGDTTGTASGNVGRFYPDHFDLSAGSITPADATGGFSYMNQPFAVSFTLTARNASGGTTANYTTANGFAKLDPATASWLSTGLGTNPSFGLGAKQGGTDLSSRLVLSGTPSGTWTTVATITANLTFSRPTSTTADATWGPYETLDIGVAPHDADGVQLLPGALNLDADSSGTSERVKMSNTTKLRFGRLRLLNAYGSELLESRVEVRAEYWDGTRWVINTLDKGTTLSAGSVFPSNLIGGIGPPSVKSITQFSAGSGGFGYIVFNKTTGPGSFDMAFNLNATGSDSSCNSLHGGTAANMPWFQGYWSAPASCGSFAAWAQDPNARIRIGSPKAPYIYLRERY